MPFSPIPRGFYPSVLSIRPEQLKAKGIKVVLADLDNTLVPYGVPEATPEIRRWKEELEAAGIELFLLSNSRKPTRASHFAEDLGIPFQGHSGKPKPGGYYRALERMHCRPEEAVMVGDQIFTDTLGANIAGVVPLLIKPIQLAGNPGRYVRYAIETPFRLIGKGRPFL